MTTIKELKKQFADGKIDHLQYANGVVKRKQYVKDQKRHKAELEWHNELMERAKDTMPPEAITFLGDKEKMIGYFISYIKEDEELAEYTGNILRNKVPEYFWQLSASSTGKYHPHDERGYYGLVLHTIRTTMLATWIGLFADLNKHSYNSLIVAAILHDTLKYGVPPIGRHTVKEHPLIACEYLDLPEDISRLIKCHVGDWFTRYEYDNMDIVQRCMYYADAMASRTYCTLSIRSDG